MKKRILLVFSAVLLLCLMALPVRAAGGTYSTSSGSGYRGDTITITTSLSESVQSASYAVSVDYDKAVLELVSGTFSYTTPNPLTGGYMGEFNVAKGIGASLYSGEISGVVFTATFKIKEDSPFGNFDVEISVAINDVWLSGSAGNVTVNCNHSYTKEEATKDNEKIPATCTQLGTYYYTCEHCGAKGTETFVGGEYGDHKYDQEKVDESYIASGADCQNKAKYYYSCVCGAKGTETFEYGTTSTHNYQHQVAKEEFIASKATCTKKATYYYTCSCGAKGTATFESGETLPHTYDKQVATETYLENKATCTKKATYYYSCVCGAKGTKTFESGELADHNYTKKDTSADYKKAEADCDSAAEYYYSCTGCGVKGTETFFDGKELEHTGGTATCTEKAVCTRCSNPYGDVLPHTYDQKKEEADYLKSEATCTTPKTYYHSCVCGEKGTTTFTVGETIAHKFTKQTESYKYLATSGSCTTKATYYYNCEVCGAKGTETFESKTAPSHSYSDEWSSDANNHWHECLYCTSKISEGKHNPGPAATETTAQTCKDCGYVIKAALGHTHKYETKYSYDATKHWYACKCGDKKDATAHTYDNDCDTTCNDCGYNRNVAHTFGTEYKCDANGHWYECTKCGIKDEVEAHIPGAEATETAPQVCTACKYELHPMLEHTHKFGEWVNDENKHWHECPCGEKADEENHEYGEGVVTKEATKKEEGSMTYTCKDCGHEKIEVIEKIAKKGCKKDLSVLVVGVISLAMVGVLFKKREN